MGGWNTDSGASLHSELIGRPWVGDGHDLRVLTFYKDNFHGTQITGEDEDYVVRCFTTSVADPPRLDPRPFLTNNYEVFVVEDLGMLPKDLLARIYHRIHKKAVSVNIIHDGKLTEDPSFYQFDWDAIVCFDERYQRFLQSVYDREKIHIIPYPCHEEMIFDKKLARQQLSLPIDRKIAFTFGPASFYTLKVVDDLFGFDDIMLLVVTRHKAALEGFYRIKSKYPILIREEAPDMNLLYRYLCASDLLLFNKPSTDWVVVSSTVFQCLGSGCPILAYASNFIETLSNEVFQYHNQEEFIKRLKEILGGGDEYKKRREAALAYVRANSGMKIARRYIKLFESLLRRRANA